MRRVAMIPTLVSTLKSWTKHTRATLRFDARSETELGTLRSYIETRFDYQAGRLGDDDEGFNNSYADQSETLAHGYIELGGFRVGVTDSQFDTFTGSAGNVIFDDVIDYGGGRTNQISYTFAGGNGFSATVGLEQGELAHIIDDYMPHVVAGLKFEQGWGAISGVAGYDALQEEFAGKIRLDVKFTDVLSAFIMGGYQSDFDALR